MVVSRHSEAGQYQRRVVDDELDALLAQLPAIALEGPRGVGKTATAERRAVDRGCAPGSFLLTDPAAPVRRRIPGRAASSPCACGRWRCSSAASARLP